MHRLGGLLSFWADVKWEIIKLFRGGGNFFDPNGVDLGTLEMLNLKTCSARSCLEAEMKPADEPQDPDVNNVKIGTLWGNFEF